MNMIDKLKIVNESIDDFMRHSDEYEQPKKKVGFTEDEELQIMELILKMKDKGTYLKKSVEMLAFRLNVAPLQIRSKIHSLLKNDLETKEAIFGGIKHSYKNDRKKLALNNKLNNRWGEN